jgi:alanine dehydrogenase
MERDGTTPLLAPMSEIAGRMAPLVGCFYLQRPRGGNGILPCGVPGVSPGRAAIIGAGVVGQGATRVAHGIGLETVLLNRGSERLRETDREYHGAVKTRMLDHGALEEEITRADLVVGAIYVTGGRTPVVITRDLLRRMKQGAVIVDVAIDQGGCVATSRPTTHDDPVFVEEGVIHYCVANMPGAFPRTSTQALTNATLPYIRQLARLGADEAVAASPELASALNLRDGMIIHPAVAAALRGENT